MFSQAELQGVASLITKYNCYAVLDEVYEHLVFDGAKHFSLRNLSGMTERAIRIGSAGKTFSFTGWKAGSRALFYTLSGIQAMHIYPVLSVVSAPYSFKGSLRCLALACQA